MTARTALMAAMLGLTMALSPLAADAQVRIGVVQGLSGPPAIVDFGESYLQGIKLAVKDYNAKGGYKSKPVELVVYDDEANPQRAVELVTRLISQDKVPVVIGTVSSGNVLAFMHLNQQHKVPLMAGPSIATPITTKFRDQPKNYIFRCSMVEEFQVNALLDWGTQKFQKIGLLHSTTGYGMFAKGEILKGLEKRNVKPLVVESTNPGATDLTPQMLKLKQAGAQLVLSFAEEWEKQYRVLPKIDYHPVIAGNWGLSSGILKDVVGADALEGTVMGQALDLSDKRAQEFDAKAAREYGKAYRWPVVVTLGYDAANLVLRAIDAAGPNADEIRDALERIDGFQAVTTGVPNKPYSKDDHECLDQKDVFLGIWKSGKVVRLK
jgi:branched-chain amino acid transport system substrate-binding protein